MQQPGRWWIRAQRVGPAPPRPRCGCPTRTADRPSPARLGCRPRRAPTPAVAVALRTGTAPARRSGYRVPRADSSTKSACAIDNAARTSSSEPSGLPSRTFSRTDAENSVASSKATETRERSTSRSRSLMSTPSRMTEPPVTSYSRLISEVSVVFPDPVAPTMATVSPGRSSRSTPRSSSAGRPERDWASANLNCTSSQDQMTGGPRGRGRMLGRGDRQR